MSSGYPPLDQFDTILAENGVNPPLPTGRVLILSNSPETMERAFGIGRVSGQTETINLYKAEVPMSAGVPRLFRLWFWHVNDLPQSAGHDELRIGIAVSVTQGTAEISNAAQHIAPIEHTPNLSVPGKCLAITQLAGALRPVNGNYLQNRPFGQDEAMLRNFIVPRRALLGGMIEFTVEATEDCSFRARFFAYRSEHDPDPNNRLAKIGTWDTRTWLEPGQIQADANYDGGNSLATPPVLRTGSNHIRGWWPNSNYIVTHSSNPIELNPGGRVQVIRYFGFIEKGGVHYAPATSTAPGGPFRGSRADDHYGSKDGNKGLYGVDIFLRVKFTNTGAESPTNVSTRMGPRNTGPTVGGVTRRGKIWGAIVPQRDRPSAGETCGIPVLHYGGPPGTSPDGTPQNLEPWNTTWRWFAGLPNVGVQPTAANATSPAVLTYRLVVGAASDLPMAFVFSGPVRTGTGTSSGPGA